MADVYLTTNLTYPAEDVLLNTSTAAQMGYARGGVVSFKAHSLPQRLSLTGSGHLRITVVLHGDPGPIPVITGEGTPISGGVLQVELDHTSRLHHTQGLVTTSGRTRSAATLTPLLTAELARIVDPDEWLLLDLPELA